VNKHGSRRTRTVEACALGGGGRPDEVGGK
jgi:hypothetical protein